MKKVSTVVFLVLLTAMAVRAQEFKKFRWNLGMGYAIPGGDGAKGGVIIHSEPAYRITDQILVGLRMEFAGMARGYSDGTTAKGNVSFAGSYALTGQYYLSDNKFRPFVGLGIGTFTLASVSGVATADNQYYYAGVATKKLGFFPRVGFDAGHFNLSLEYNLIGKTKLEGYSSTTHTISSSAPKIDQKNGYIGVKFGVFIGGGRK
jgi:hypothetical protein